MAEPEIVDAEIDDSDDENKVEYNPPAPKSVEDMMKADADDESLQRYKKNLLGDTPCLGDGGKVEVDVTGMMIETGGEEHVFDLTKKDQKIHFTGITNAEYQIKLTFDVKNQLVCGLKLVNKVSKDSLIGKVAEKVGVKGIQDIMIGSFPPRIGNTCKTRLDTFPDKAGVYKVKSEFKDDDKNTFTSWNWTFELKKKQK